MNIAILYTYLELRTLQPKSQDHKMTSVKWPSLVPFTDRLVEGPFMKGFSYVPFQKCIEVRKNSVCP